jgi:WD domain, G-beta repeat
MKLSKKEKMQHEDEDGISTTITNHKTSSNDDDDDEDESTNDFDNRIENDDDDDDDDIDNNNDNDEYNDNDNEQYTFPTKIMICAGTYDGVLAGWEYEESISNLQQNKKRRRIVTTDSNSNVQLKLSFASPVHIGSVRSLTIASQSSSSTGNNNTNTNNTNRPGSLLSCGYDEVLKMHDFAKRLTSSGEVKTPSDYGTPVCSSYAPPYYPSASITRTTKSSSSSSQPLSTHCIVGFTGGNIVIYKKRDWSVQHVLQGHEGGVASLAVHPSGCLALSGGLCDGKLKLWDLTKGRLSFVTKINKTKTPTANNTLSTNSTTYEPIDCIVWEGTEGVAYAYSHGHHITCREVATGIDLLDVELPSRVNQIALLMGPDGMFVAAACNDGSLPVLAVQDVSTMTGSPRAKTAVERRAIMAIEPVDGPVAGEERFRCIQTLSGYYVVTANSAGVVSIMNLHGAVKMILSASEESESNTQNDDDDDSDHDAQDQDDDENDEVEAAVEIIDSVQLGSGARITALTTWCSFDSSYLDDVQVAETTVTTNVDSVEGDGTMKRKNLEIDVGKQERYRRVGDNRDNHRDVPGSSCT